MSVSRINQRLRRLIESDICQAEDFEGYREELRSLAREVASIKASRDQGRFFKALSDEKRIRILKLLQVRDMCVCEMTIALDLTQPNLSHHIKILEKEEIVTHKKKGKWAFYTLENREIMDYINEMNADE